jgi:TRPM family ion channel
VEGPVRITFPDGRGAAAVRIENEGELEEARDALGLVPPRSTLVLVGGADGLGEVERDRLRPVFEHSLAPLAESLGAVVVDGGTDAGVMALIGEAREAGEARFPLVGVLVAELAGLRDRDGRITAERLEPRHTHFVLVPGSEWGDEAECLARFATVVAGSKPSVTVLVDGGEFAWEDVRASVSASRPVTVLTDSGRTADELAQAAAGHSTDRRASALVATGLIHAVHVGDPRLPDRLGSFLTGR